MLLATEWALRDRKFSSWEHQAALSDVLYIVRPNRLSMRMLFVISGLFYLTVSAAGQASVITALVLDQDQNIYLGSSDGLSKMDASTRQMTGIMDGVKVNALAWSKRHGLMVGCNDREVRTVDGRLVMTLDNPDASISTMMISGSQLWVGTDKGVYVMSLTREELAQQYNSGNSSLPVDKVNTMYADGSGIKWIGTDRGVVRIEGDKKWKVYEPQTKFLAIAGNIEGVWLAGNNEMWLVDPFNRWTPTNVQDGLSEGVIRSVATDNKGRIYVLSDIFVQFDPYTNEIIPVDNQAPNMVAQNVALAIDKEDQLWIATREAGLRMIDPEVDLAERPLSATVIIGHPTCAGMSNGSIEIQAEGGKPPYDYYWGDPQFAGTKLGGLSAGTYEILVSDAGGNHYEDVVTLHTPSPLELAIEEDDSAEGFTLAAQGYGGFGDLRYAWSSGQSARKISIESGGDYYVTATDVNGCTATAAYRVDASRFIIATPEPLAETIEENPTAPALESVTVETLRELDARTLNVGQVLRIEQLQFQADSSAIRPESYAVLDGIALFLRQNQQITIEIGGHTNGLPDDAYCDKLSTSRAKSVAEYLHDQGVPTERITYHGYGKRKPVATNETVAGRKKNQRVEVKILQL